MLLCKTTAGKTYRIEKTDLQTELLDQLQARGIDGNTKFLVLDRRNTGAVVILCRSSRFALGSYYTTRITVQEA